MYKIFQLNMIVIQKQLHGRHWYFSQLDPVALDKACIDKIYHSQDAWKKKITDLIENVYRNHIIDAWMELHIGNKEYDLVEF